MLYGNNTISNEFGLLDILTIISVVLQVSDHDKNSKQLTNDDLMKELQNQDRKYLDTIIENQNEILSMLRQIVNSPK